MALTIISQTTGRMSVIDPKDQKAFQRAIAEEFYASQKPAESIKKDVLVAPSQGNIKLN